jgi:hypothetical protein
MDLAPDAFFLVVREEIAAERRSTPVPGGYL